MQGALSAARQIGQFVLLLALFLIGFASPAVAEAETRWGTTVVTCEKAAGPGPVLLSASGGRGADLIFRRSGEELVIREERYAQTEVACGPGSLRLDEITEVRLVEDDVEFDSSFEIDLTNGPLGPGAGADHATPEIEFDLPVNTSFNAARFYGVGARPGGMYIGRSDGPKADLNGDGDIDVRWLGTENTLVVGTAGDDLLDATGDAAGLGASYRSYTFQMAGGGGDDEIVLDTVDSYSWHNGGPGDDTFRVHGAIEAPLHGGDGMDTLILEPGSEGADLFTHPGIERVVRAGEEVDPRLDPEPSVRILAARMPEALPGLKRRGVSVRVVCSEDCNSRVELSTGRRAVRQGMPWVLGVRSVDLPAGVPTWITVHLRPLARRAVADNRPWRFNIRTWVKATFADGTIRQRWIVSEIG